MALQAGHSAVRRRGFIIKIFERIVFPAADCFFSNNHLNTNTTMKKKYEYPVTTTADTMSLAMLCASGGGVTPPSHDTSSGTGGDPNDAI
jgi:hypothetical protein